MHSTLAGFVEPGESLEEAVVREIWEEVGLRLAVEEVRYQSSQPWPFPSSIMLGFYARAEHQPPSLGPDELESARWFSRDELLNSPEDERSEEHTSELQSLMRISYAVFCLKKKKTHTTNKCTTKK